MDEEVSTTTEGKPKKPVAYMGRYGASGENLPTPVEVAAEKKRVEDNRRLAKSAPDWRANSKSTGVQFN